MQLRSEIKALQRKLGFAAIHVTHDREEAMTMADRIVVMDQGRIVQEGPPEQVYDRPASAFIASFMGADNTIDLDVASRSAGVEIRVQGAVEPVMWSGSAPRGRVRAYFRDDAAQLVSGERASGELILLAATITSRAYPGGHYRYALDVSGRNYSVNDTQLREVGAPIYLGLPIKDLHMFEIEDDVKRERKLP